MAASVLAFDPGEVVFRDVQFGEVGAGTLTGQHTPTGPSLAASPVPAPAALLSDATCGSRRSIRAPWPSPTHLQPQSRPASGPAQNA